MKGNNSMVSEIINVLSEIGDSLEDYTTEELKIELQRRKNKRWKPGCDEIYWYIDRTGFAVSCHWNNDGIDKDAYAIGNVYRTEEEAQFAADKRKALVRMHDWARRYDEEGKKTFYIFKARKEITCVSLELNHPNILPKFSSKNIAYRFIDTFRDGLEKYIFDKS